MLTEKPGIMGSADQLSTLSPPPQTEQVLRMKYNDMATLQEGLNKIYGHGQYKLRASKPDATFFEWQR